MSLIEMKKMDSCGEKPKDKKSDGLLDICIVTTHSEQILWKGSFMKRMYKSAQN